MELFKLKTTNNIIDYISLNRSGLCRNNNGHRNSISYVVSGTVPCTNAADCDGKEEEWSGQTLCKVDNIMRVFLFNTQLHFVVQCNRESFGDKLVVDHKTRFLPHNFTFFIVYTQFKTGFYKAKDY